MTNVFSTHYGFDSILTLEPAREIVDNAPTSVFSIAKACGLPEVHVADSSFSGFWEAYKNAEAAGVELRWGFKVVLCSNVEDKTVDSRVSESRVTVWMQNSEGYRGIIKLATFAATTGHYDYPRIDAANLKRLWTENLGLSVPFYSSFLARNITMYRECDFGLNELNPFFQVEEHGLIFDDLIRERVEQYCKTNNLDCWDTNSVYYYKKEDFLAYQVYRCILKRSTLQKPEMPFCISDSFCFRG